MRLVVTIGIVLFFQTMVLFGQGNINNSEYCFIFPNTPVVLTGSGENNDSPGFRFIPRQIAGIPLIASGGTFCITGGILFAVQMGYFNPLVQSMKTDSSVKASYAEYQRNAVANTGLFVVGITFISVGVLLVGAGIPLLVIPARDKKKTALVLHLWGGAGSVGLDVRIALSAVKTGRIR